MARECLDDETQNNIEKIPDEMQDSWGCDGVWEPCDGVYEEKTQVRSGTDALEAFERYTEYFETVLDEWEPESDELVLVPCGASKPIGSSTLHQKKVSAIRDGGLEDADIVIVSEPCAIVPPKYRLSVPAANYDFPPEYTVKEDHPEVFEVFTDRLAEWMDKMDYDTIYPFLISGHQSKFEAALEKMETDPTVHTVPSASFNPETESYSGDRFKTLDDMTMKVRAVLSVRAEKDVELPSEYGDFYKNRWE